MTDFDDLGFDDVDIPDADGFEAEVDANDNDISEIDGYANDDLANINPTEDGALPDPINGRDVVPIRFGSTTTFPDGTEVEDAHTDALGYKYENTNDWINGTNKFVSDNEGNADPA